MESTLSKVESQARLTAGETEFPNKLTEEEQQALLESGTITIQVPSEVTYETREVMVKPEEPTGFFPVIESKITKK